MIYAFTSAALNYLPKARLCLGSIRRHHPDFRLVYALADRLPDGISIEEDCVDEVIAVDDIPIIQDRSWIFQHSIVELSTAIKPFVLQQLLQRPDCEAVIYFDPDIVLFSPLDEIVGALNSSSILLTPHQLAPERTMDAVIDNEICSLHYGIFNLGFFAVKSNSIGNSFAQWWSERLMYFCHDRLDIGLFTDQKWINHAPVFFDEVTILKEPRFNVATWNITTREVSGSSIENIRVFDKPLGFYHFTGFDSGAHRVMADKYGRDNPAVALLIDWYEQAIVKTEADLLAQQPWFFGRYANGRPIERWHRELYRDRKDLQAAFPDPFAVDGALARGKANGHPRSYCHWLDASGEIEYARLKGFAPGEGTKLLIQEHEQLRAQLSDLKNSLSWRLTRPLRAIFSRGR